jgi:hypothetical protein
MKYLKKYEELTWSDLEAGKFEYYVQGGKGANELIKIKTDILESMDPPMVDVWESLSDSLLELKEKWATFRTKYDSDREVVDFDSLDLNVDIKEDTDYTIAHESDTFYNRGNTLKIVDRSKKEKHRKFLPDGTERGYDSRISMYGSDFDQKFYNFYMKNSQKVNTMYNFLIGFESEYVNNNIEKLNEMLTDLIKSIKTSIKRLNGKIVKLEYFDNEKSKWRKINDLSQMNYPRVSVSFVIN